MEFEEFFRRYDEYEKRNRLYDAITIDEIKIVLMEHEKKPYCITGNPGEEELDDMVRKIWADVDRRIAETQENIDSIKKVLEK